MKVFALPILLAWGLVATGAHASTAPSKEAALPGIAATLIASHAAAAKPAELIVLYRLQLAAGRYVDAEATLDRLAAAYRSSEPRLVPSVVPWQTYARAKAYEANGSEASAALRRAFSELYGSLPDDQAVDIGPWYEVDLDAVRANVAEQEKACTGMQLADCPSAAKLIAARQGLAAWTYLVPALKPLLEADTQRRFLVDDQILIPTPDGAKIAAILVRPRSAQSTKLTALLNFTIYANDDWSMDDAKKMAAHGYAGVVAYTRGKGRSPGAVVPYVHDGEDASTVIAWLARQPWSDGRVGMFSGSYNGFTQWAAAKHHPPALKAIATHATNAPGIDTPMQGNVFQSFIYYWPFYTTDTKGLDDKAFDDRAHWAGLERQWYVSGKPYRDLDKIDGRPNPIFDTWLKHPSYDAYWQRLIPYGREFADIDIPVFVETGYYDGGMVGALYYFQQHLKYRPSADDRMLIGPYHHIAMQTGVLPEIDGYVVDKAALLDLQDVRLKWFEHVFRGAPLPDLLSDRVNFEVMGANTWRHVSTLADMAASYRRFYLTGRREADRLLFDGASDKQSLPPELVVNFADRSDADFSPPAGMPDTRNALVFETQKLTKALEIDGLFQGRFEIVTNKRDFDLAVNFYVLTPDGKYLDLASYLGRASYMQDRTRRHLLQPGQPNTLAFQSQVVTARLLPAGSRIVAVVGVPKTPQTQINYGTGRDVSTESMADAGDPLRIRWLAGSYLELGMRGSFEFVRGR
ncbi:CocE/NonD family hydrolase [Rhodanobacter sp. DHG33]|uniref:CocE/NonD family hydrolase n=1 Tax=Rhodanobacter sp. DHG33 TaxID=2775921 RepID=UPI001784D7D1|nr:CocE/NonD family hydrolase [Rhodanobacter sp. DHG33]MBD8899059.1 CocE/NonD family hydrolase [Rhodanobacter sp. DHG33]